MGETSQVVKQMESNTDETINHVAKELPADSNITPQALLYALYASDTEYTQSITDDAISDVFSELESGVNMNPHSTSNPLPEELNRPDVDEIDTDHPMGGWYDIEHGPQRVLLDSIGHSWDLKPVDDRMLIDYHAAVTPYLHHTEPILDVLPPEVMTPDAEEPTRTLDSAFQQRVVVLSLLHVHRNITKSNFSEREGIIYHLSGRFTTDEIATIIESEFGGSVSTGSIRKSISRLKDKLNQAEFMANTYSVDSINSDVDLSPNGFSLLSGEQMSQAVKFISGMLSTQKRQQSEKSWEIADGVVFALQVHPPDEINAIIYCDIDSLPSPVTVDNDHVGNSEMVQTVHDDGHLSSMSSMSEEFMHTMGDIRLVLETALQRVDRVSHPDTSQPLKLIATETYESDEYESGGFVMFNQWIDLLD